MLICLLRTVPLSVYVENVRYNCLCMVLLWLFFGYVAHVMLGAIVE